MTRMPGDNLIDKFLSTSHSPLKLNKPLPENQPLATENEIISKSLTEDEELVTETLANIYTKQKKYDKALEAFKKLSLKYPEKNSYFATRIEEIEKFKNI
jgi:tetratricopeptide (TPR) repeat protein